MGLNSYVRKRKAVKADRAESGSHEKLVAALGGRRQFREVNPGAGHVSLKINHNTASWETLDTASNAGRMGILPDGYQSMNKYMRDKYGSKSKNKTGIEPNVVDRHKPTEDF